MHSTPAVRIIPPVFKYLHLPDAQTQSQTLYQNNCCIFTDDLSVHNVQNKDIMIKEKLYTVITVKNPLPLLILSDAHPKAELSSVERACVCWAVKGSLLREYCSSVSTREPEKDPDVKLETEQEERGGGGWNQCDQRADLPVSHGWHSHTYINAHTRKKAAAKAN